MLNERTVELIQAGIDGELGENEQSELQVALECSAEARQFHADMARIDQLIASLPDVEPPAGLTRKILDRIHLPAKRRFAGLSAVFDRSWFAPASYGLAVAAGVLVAVGVVQMAPQDRADMSTLVGTMVSGGSDASQPVTGELNFELTQLQGQVTLKKTDEALALEFDLRSQEEVKISVDILDSGLEFGGFARQDGSVSLENIEVSEKAVTVSNRGDHQFVLFLRHGAHSGTDLKGIGIAVSQAGTVVYRGRLESRG